MFVQIHILIGNRQRAGKSGIEIGNCFTYTNVEKLYFSYLRTTYYVLINYLLFYDPPRNFTLFKHSNILNQRVKCSFVGREKSDLFFQVFYEYPRAFCLIKQKSRAIGETKNSLRLCTSPTSQPGRLRAISVSNRNKFWKCNIVYRAHEFVWTF